MPIAAKHPNQVTKTIWIKLMCKYIRALLFCLLLLATGFVHAQNITGFQNGDKALIRFLEKNFTWDNWEDSIPYRFTLAAIAFDSTGNWDSLTYSCEGYLDYKNQINRVFQKTRGMWDKTVARNQLLIIPFELTNIGRRDEESYQASQRMLSYEFQNLFKNEFAHPVILLKPVIIMTYGPISKKVPGQ